jgi:hypothetical protein
MRGFPIPGAWSERVLSYDNDPWGGTMVGRLWRRRPSHATVVAYLALAVALSTGTAYAANTIGSSDVIDNSLLSRDVHNGTLVADDLAVNTIGSGRIKDNSLTMNDIVGADVHGTISLSGVPDGRCTQFTLSTSGAKVGQSALISTRAAIQNGIVLYAQRVSSHNHVEAVACNFSGTTMTPISGFPVRVVTFG